MPASVKTILDAEYPGWQYPPLLEDWIIRGYKSGKLKPFLITGDFDGDKKRDFAVQIVHAVDSAGTKERVVLTLLKRGERFEKTVLESAPFVSGNVDIIL